MLQNIRYLRYLAVFWTAKLTRQAILNLGTKLNNPSPNAIHSFGTWICTSSKSIQFLYTVQLSTLWNTAWLGYWLILYLRILLSARRTERSLIWVFYFIYFFFHPFCEIDFIKASMRQYAPARISTSNSKIFQINPDIRTGASRLKDFQSCFVL